jgi:hypothetical protein
MTRSFLIVAVLVCAMVGLVMLPVLAQPEKADNQKKDIDDAKSLRAKLDQALKLNDGLIKELDDRVKDLAEQQERHDKTAKRSAERIRVLETALRDLDAAVPKAPAADREATIAQMLQERIETKGLQDRVKLKVALEYFSGKFEGKLPILVNRSAFAELLGADAADPYEEEVSLPPVPSRLRFETALRLVLSQVGVGQASYFIRRGYIEVVPAQYTTAAYFLYQPMAAAIYDKRPLRGVLDDLADETGVSIHLDPQVGTKAGTPITATLRNASLEDALTTVTEMAQLKYVVLQRSVYVTTPEHAKTLEKEEAIRRKQRESAPQPKMKRLEAAME